MVRLILTDDELEALCDIVAPTRKVIDTPLPSNRLTDATKTMIRKLDVILASRNILKKVEK